MERKKGFHFRVFKPEDRQDMLCALPRWAFTLSGSRCYIWRGTGDAGVKEGRGLRKVCMQIAKEHISLLHVDYRSQVTKQLRYPKSSECKRHIYYTTAEFIVYT